MAITATPAPRGRSRPRLRVAAIIVLVIAVVLALAAWAATIVLRPHLPTPAALTSAMKTQAALTGGAQVYVTHCAYCHDTGFAPSIAGMNLAPEAVTTYVRSGPGMMPAFPSSQVSDADIAAVARYINSLPAKAQGGK